jgi:GT2 family glycosyltransferase
MIPLCRTGLVDVAAGLILPCVDDPQVSIVMPVFNQASYTLCCLQSIAAHPPQASIEIIVIDDGSTDQTPEMLAAARGIRVLRNDLNQGFLRSANRGAWIARGEYLHFLNNDTQVQAGWVDALLAVFHDEPETGLSGSKLIYPNGYLQEAGAALKRDGRVELIGLDDNPSLDPYNLRRRVDHCSGASVLIEKTLFDRLGGFDEVYAPAYYEDCDLSLRVRALGRNVVYEPSSVVIHHLSVTTNAHPDEKLKRIATNKTIFLHRWQSTLDDIDSVRLLAFYLPQFHPIPENDRWWGKGFTEWTNVTRAKPNFPGHEQPHLPADLGFYDLRVAETRQAQADLARQYGVYGFCYYYYWFGGKRLLHRPLDEVLASGEPDFPFCICWANENWSRRWDGRDSDVLIAQEHSDADDLAFIGQLEPLLRDPRYIRIHGRPLMLVYRIGLLPDAARTAAIWRDYCRKSGIGELFLANVQSFGSFDDPTAFGFDAAVEFPPHERAVLLEPQPQMRNPAFKGLVFDYPATAARFMQRPLPRHPFFRTAMPSWDNTARRQNTSDIFVNSTPEDYGRWLSYLVEQARQVNAPGERIVFINAWNEWAEGNHLEPDQRHGHGYLEATRRALGALRPIGFGDVPVEGSSAPSRPSMERVS